MLRYMLISNKSKILAGLAVVAMLSMSSCKKCLECTFTEPTGAPYTEQNCGNSDDRSKFKDNFIEVAKAFGLTDKDVTCIEK
jgi:hypothetical protein